MIPAGVIARLASLGLTADQTAAVADMLHEVEHATERKASEALEARRASDRLRKQRERGHVKSRDDTGQHVTGRDGADSETAAPRVRVLYGEESKSIPPVGANAPTAPKGARGDRGTRIPDDWTPDEKSIADAHALGLFGDELDEFVVDYREFWLSVPGARGRKIDWNLTFRGRLRQTGGRLNFRQSRQTGPPHQSAKPKSALRLVHEMRAEREQSHHPPDRSPGTSAFAIEG